MTRKKVARRKEENCQYTLSTASSNNGFSLVDLLSPESRWDKPAQAGPPTA